MKFLFALYGAIAMLAALAFTLVLVDGYDIVYLFASAVLCGVFTFFWCFILYDLVGGV